MNRLLEFTAAFAYFEQLAGNREERRRRQRHLRGVTSVAGRLDFVLRRCVELIEQHTAQRSAKNKRKVSGVKAVREKNEGYC